MFCVLWKHSGVSLKEKINFFQTLVISKLQYGLSTITLVKAQRRRLDGFYVRCLRKILRIPAAYYSRISNQTVLEKAGQAPFTEQLLYRQFVLLGKIARSPLNSPLRRDTFVGASVSPMIGHFIRIVGRPRQDWTNYLLKEGATRLGHEKFQQMLVDRSDGAQQRWISELQRALKS